MSVEVVGVDEAGYGPLLGPLVVAAVALRVPEPNACPWQLLSDAVTPAPGSRDARVLVADSKLVLQGRSARGLAKLERAVLAFLRASGEFPSTSSELLDVLAPVAPADSLAEPWYREGDVRLPVFATPDELDGALAGVTAAMVRSGVGIARLRCDVLGEGRYNAAVAASETKAAVLFDCAAALLDAVRSAATRRVVVDRQGGRARYAVPLQRAFPEAFVWTAGEGAQLSTYRLTDALGDSEVSFEVGADRRHFTVALASMIAKYVRELCMVRFNRYWAKRVPGIAPTAGYWTDGQRFLGDLARAAETTPLGELPVVRCR